MARLFFLSKQLTGGINCHLQATLKAHRLRHDHAVINVFKMVDIDDKYFFHYVTQVKRL